MVIAAQSEWLAYRRPVYIVAGFAGILGLALLLLQPLLAGVALPLLQPRAARLAHRSVGAGLVTLVVVHVAGLWITSPPDMIDALTLTAPTWFSVWGVVAMWAIFATAALALLRRKVGLRLFRRWHTLLAVLIAGASVAHALLIEGTMGQGSKVVLCAAVIGALIGVIGKRWSLRG